jgi:ferredoxin
MRSRASAMDWPANVLPVAVNEITQLGIEAWTAPVAWGAVAIRALSSKTPSHDLEGLDRNITIANLLGQSLGYGADVCDIIYEDDPDGLQVTLAQMEWQAAIRNAATFLPMGDKRSLLKSSVIGLYQAAPTPVQRTPLPAAGAIWADLMLMVDPRLHALPVMAYRLVQLVRFPTVKSARRFSLPKAPCVQCGLCAATCPEKVITLVPQLDFQAWDLPRRVVKGGRALSLH